MANIWESIKQKALQFLGGLIMEEGVDGKYTISLGRVSFWFVFVPALIIWISSQGNLEDGIAVKDISPNHLTILLTLIGYNFGKKAVDIAKKVWDNNDGPG